MKKHWHSDGLTEATQGMFCSHLKCSVRKVNIMGSVCQKYLILSLPANGGITLTHSLMFVGGAGGGSSREGGCQ